jgi:flavin-dependent dehydrogenase
VVEKATFPADTLSTNLFQADGLAFLDRLGVTEQLRAAGAPFMTRTDLRVDDFRCVADLPLHPGDVGGAACVRRFVLDPILANAAADAGADIEFGTSVTGVVRDAGRVRGVRVATAGGGEAELRARVVVGADGRNSTIARLCGARKYNVTANERFAYWAYFEGANLGPSPTLLFHKWGDQHIFCAPTDGGLYMAATAPGLSDLERFRTDIDVNLMRSLCDCEPVAAALDGARRVGKVLGIVRFSGFFRDPSGPGWVLAGDAGHFKDPCAGRGIGDAFRQADTLVPAIIDGLSGSDSRLDATLADWGRRRDGELAEYYWQAVDLGTAGPFPTPTPDLLRRLEAQGKLDQFFDILSHRARPSKVFTPPRLLAATARVLARRGCERRAVLRELGRLTMQDTRRRRLNRHPVYTDDDAVEI